MDDLAVDSDEEVDYSKMDQVSTAPSMHQQCVGSVNVVSRYSKGLWSLCSLVYSEGDDRKWGCVMFQGNKKGPLGRWDFDTQEEYSDYMNNKEALPK